MRVDGLCQAAFRSLRLSKAGTVFRHLASEPPEPTPALEAAAHNFVCSKGDLFHDDVSDKTLNEIFTIMAETPRHTYMVLTKRPVPMVFWLCSISGCLLKKLKDNVWLGVSVEDQQRANECLPFLIINWPGQRVACLEPLLDPIDLRSWLHELDWVITGGETGPGSRKADPRHLREVRDQCAAVGVPLFFKQWAAGITSDSQTHWTVENGNKCPIILPKPAFDPFFLRFLADNDPPAGCCLGIGLVD